MKFTCPAPRLVRAIQAAGSLAPGTNKRFQIESTLLTVDDTGHLEIQATDLSDSYWFRIEPEPGKAFTPGRAFVPSVNLVRAVKEAAKNDVTIELVKHQVVITWAKTTVRLPTEDPGDAPPITRVDRGAPCVSLPAQMLMDLFKRVNFAVSSDFKNRSFSFVKVETREKSLRLSATDGIRMAAAEIPVEKLADYRVISFVLPVKPAKLKLLVDGEEDKPVEVRLGADLISVASASSEMTIRTGNANWPDFDIERDMPCEKKTVVPTKELKLLLKNAELLKVRGETTCEFKFDAEGLEMCALASIEGMVNSKIPVEWPHGPFAIKLDAGYFYESVAACDTATVELGFNTDQEPMILKESGHVVYLFALGARY